jgi:hypothetical protein
MLLMTIVMKAPVTPIIVILVISGSTADFVEQVNTNFENREDGRWQFEVWCGGVARWCGGVARMGLITSRVESCLLQSFFASVFSIYLGRVLRIVWTCPLALCGQFESMLIKLKALFGK